MAFPGIITIFDGTRPWLSGTKTWMYRSPTFNFALWPLAEVQTSLLRFLRIVLQLVLQLVHNELKWWSADLTQVGMRCLQWRSWLAPSRRINVVLSDEGWRTVMNHEAVWAALRQSCLSVAKPLDRIHNSSRTTNKMQRCRWRVTLMIRPTKHSFRSAEELRFTFTAAAYYRLYGGPNNFIQQPTFCNNL